MFLHNFWLSVTSWGKVLCQSNYHYNKFCCCVECLYKVGWLYSIVAMLPRRTVKALIILHGCHNVPSLFTYALTLSTLGKIFPQATVWNIFLIFPRKQDLTFHANCLHWRQFAWNGKSCLMRKIMKISSICRLRNLSKALHKTIVQNHNSR